MSRSTFSTRTGVILLILLLATTAAQASGEIIDLTGLIVATQATPTPTPATTHPGDIINLAGLIIAPEVKLTSPPQQSGGSMSLSGWSATKPDRLKAMEVLLTVLQNGREYFYTYHKHEKRSLPNIALAVGESIVIKVTVPNLSGVGTMTRNAPDSDSLGKSTLRQIANPAVRRGGSLALGAGGWNGRSVEWRITATAETGGKSTMATLTLMCNTATGAGPDGGSEAKYMPKVLVNILPRSAELNQFQKLGDTYLFVPNRPTNKMIVWLAGGGEKGDAALSYGLPKLAAQLDSNQIILVPTKQTNSWNATSVVNTINETLDYLARNGYRIEQVYGEGFSAGAQGIAEVASTQQLNIPFTSIRLFGGNTNGNTAKLLRLLNSGNISSVSFYVGANDSQFINRVKSDYRELAQSGKAALSIIPNVGHKIDPLYAYTKNTP